MISKTCAKCKKKLPVGDFHSHNSIKSCRLNVNSRCKNCRAEDRKVPIELSLKRKQEEDERLSVNILTPTDAAYLAGIIDGEGSIGLNKVHSNSIDHTSTYVIRMRVANTDKALMDWICVKVGYGSVRKVKVGEDKSHYKQAYEWYLSNRRVIDVLKQIYPYLKVKRLQADVAFEYQETIGISYGKKLSSEIIDTRDDLKSKIVSLNQRGA
uniref:Putative homing endonuclease n=1 Tax=viral metagenome TaxID=1070528 RepID=A0A6M3J2L2_9ZZZZ